MSPIRVFDVIYRRRMVFIGTAIGLIIIASVVLSANFFGNSKKAKAVGFEASTSKLVVPQDEIIYIGSSGYVSQRFYSKEAEPINSAHQLSQTGSPADHIYNTQVASVNCPDASVWGASFASGKCRSIVGDGTGMILKFIQEIDIYGTVVIGDRVAFDSPNITIHSTGKIFANGQDNQLGWHDDCGAGGAGGINGGATTWINPANPNELGISLEGDHIYTCGEIGPFPNGSTEAGDTSTQTSPESRRIWSKYNIFALDVAVASYFKDIAGYAIAGGNGAKSGPPLDNPTHGNEGLGATAVIGVGGGGGSGPAGDIRDDDTGSSGGGGGGFGVAFKTQSLKVDVSAEVNATGGDSLINLIEKQLTPLSGAGELAGGGFGGPGGGGVIIISAPEINFSDENHPGSQVSPNYEIFDAKAGIFLPQNDSFNSTVFAPAKASDGKVIVYSGGGVSVKKTVINVTAGSSGRPNYVFRAGDTVQVTLDIANLTIGQAATVSDDIFYDGRNMPTVNPALISNSGKVAGTQVVWIIANPRTTKMKLTYTMVIN